MTLDVGARIIEKARELGATMAGFASVELLKRSPSYQIIKKLDTEGVDPSPIQWPTEATSALVIVLAHPQSEPELDWWDSKGSPGDRILVRIKRELSVWIEERFGIGTHRLSYSIGKGGTYLKDAAVLAGLGCIGVNNLLITPGFGPRVRLRAMLLEAELVPTGPIEFDPCDGCDQPCRKACPQNAFGSIVLETVEAGMAALPGRDGRFSRDRCMIQMDKDSRDAGTGVSEQIFQFAVDSVNVPRTKVRIKYCRCCEFACPVGN